jgi:hypothetical protein
MPTRARSSTFVLTALQKSHQIVGVNEIFRLSFSLRNAVALQSTAFDGIVDHGAEVDRFAVLDFDEAQICGRQLHFLGPKKHKSRCQTTPFLQCRIGRLENRLNTGLNSGLSPAKKDGPSAWRNHYHAAQLISRIKGEPKLTKLFWQ